jgi:hypothetical protein
MDAMLDAAMALSMPRGRDPAAALTALDDPDVSALLIGGTYARFVFTRYDQKKPGIPACPGPFLDGAAAGRIAGCTPPR